MSEGTGDLGQKGQGKVVVIKKIGPPPEWLQPPQKKDTFQDFEDGNKRRGIKLTATIKDKEEVKVVEVSEEDLIGTVIIVSGTDKKTEKDPYPAYKHLTWVLYKTSVYCNMSYDRYKNLKKEDSLPEPDYITYLSRDAHQSISSSGKIFKHSSKRYGNNNEIPPGEYYLKKKIPGQKYEVYIVDSSDKSADALNGIEGIHGDRGGVAIHEYCPRFSVGCLTLNTDQGKSAPEVFIKQIPDLQTKNSVRIILEEREVKETTWDNPQYGTTKWTGI